MGLGAADLVALSGGHTIGLGHCSSFEGRLFPRPDPSMDAAFAGRLRQTCPATRPLVQRFARDQKAFFDQFVSSMVKMGQIKVLTAGNQQGQIRTNCSARNPGAATMPWPSILDVHEAANNEGLLF
ncbi:unnamed protein product [Urochloa humidicola]